MLEGAVNRVMEQEELTGIDYITVPLLNLQRHSDYSPKAHVIISQISQMTSAQLEELDISEDY